MAGRSPEANYHAQFSNPEKVQSGIQMDSNGKGQQERPQLDFKESKWRKGARYTRNWNAGTGAVWLAGSAVVPPLAILAAIDGATAAGAHMVVRREDRKAAEVQNAQDPQTQAEQPIRTRREQPGFQPSENRGSLLPFARRRPARQTAVIGKNAA